MCCEPGSHSAGGLQEQTVCPLSAQGRIADEALWETAQQANRGILDADLGGGVIKQRIARTGEGRSGGSRSIILFRQGSRAVYVYGFEQKDRASITPDDLEAFRELAKVVLGYSVAEIAEMVRQGALIAVPSPQEKSNA